MTHLGETAPDNGSEHPGRDDMRHVTVNTALSRLGIGRTTFYALVNQGAVEVVKLGGRTFVRDLELRRFMAALPTVRPKQAA